MKIDLKEAADRIEAYLSGLSSAEILCKWYLAEHFKVASHQAERRLLGESLKDQVASIRDKDHALTNEIFLDLDSYRSEEYEQTDFSINEEELRQRLTHHLIELKKLFPFPKL